MRELRFAGVPISLTDPHLLEVKKYIRFIAADLRLRVIDEAKQKPIALMIDIATKNRLSILGISIQYISEDHLPKTVPIGIKELIDFNTERNLAKVVTDTLAEYGLSMAQVITCTTDNGSNMLKMLDEFDVFTSDISTENTNIEIESDQTIEESNDQELMDDINIREVLQDPISDDDALDLIFVESSLFEDILEEMVSELQHQNGSQIFSVDSIRCAAHTLQLAVRDASDKISPNIKNVI